MKIDLIPLEEPARLQKLRSLDILDTSAESWFDELVLLAGQICDVPIALIGLIDETRQWNKAVIGFENFHEQDRELSFCSHAILSNELMEVRDTLLDDRFVDNPMVVNAPYLRFYAGAPLISSKDGLAMGTICVADTRPRQLSDSQKQALQILADQVMTLMEMRQALVRVRKRSRKLAALLDASEHYKILLDDTGKVITANRAARKGSASVFMQAPVIGADLHKCLHMAQRSMLDTAIWHAKEGKTYQVEVPFEQNLSKKGAWFEFRFEPVPTLQAGGKMMLSLHISDCNERRAALEREEFHRKHLLDLSEYESHTLRGPLTAIQGIARLMQPSGMDEHNQEMLGLLIRSAAQMDKVVDDLMAGNQEPRVS